MPQTVLVVEDSENVAATLEVALTKLEGVRVLILASAQEALKLFTNGGHDIAALVTDLNLPFVDGFALIEAVRGNQQYARLPIVVVSGDCHPDTPERLRRLGANAYFPKPSIARRDKADTGEFAQSAVRFCYWFRYSSLRFTRRKTTVHRRRYYRKFFNAWTRSNSKIASLPVKSIRCARSWENPVTRPRKSRLRRPKILLRPPKARLHLLELRLRMNKLRSKTACP